MSRGKAFIIPTLLSRIKRGERLLIAVSGGIDSMVLLHGVVQILRQRDLTLEVAHIDHGLRNGSMSDARFVEKHAKRYGVRFHLLRAVPPAKRVNIEEWGRKTRYAFLEKIRKQRNLSLLLTAHHANDLAETLLMRILTNKEPHLIAACDSRRHILRPLLEVSRAEIERYAEAERLSWREDPSNQSDQFLRNRIRNKLIPFLAHEFDPRIVEVLAHRGGSVAEDQELLYSTSKQALASLKRYRFGAAGWLRAVHGLAEKLPPGIGWRAVEELFFGKLGFRIGRRHAQSVLSVLKYDSIGCELPSGWRIMRSKGRLLVGRERARKSVERALPKRSTLDKP